MGGDVGDDVGEGWAAPPHAPRATTRATVAATATAPDFRGDVEPVGGPLPRNSVRAIVLRFTLGVGRCPPGSNSTGPQGPRKATTMSARPSFRKRVLVTVSGGLLLAGGGGLAASAAYVAAPAASVGGQLALQPNHLLHGPGAAAKPGGGGGSSTPWPGWQSSNWSGYAVTTSSASPFTSVSGTWTVPAVSRSKKATYSAAWIGIDGFNNSSLIQTGTEQDYYSGGVHDAVWWTTSAQNFAEQTISEPVATGDHIAASITGSIDGNWTITLSDTTDGWTFTKTLAYTGPGTSAEWIMEAPTVGGRIAPLAQYTTFPFDLGTVNGASVSLTPATAGEMLQGPHAQVISIPSVPDPDVDGFNVAYGSTQPAAPATS